MVIKLKTYRGELLGTLIHQIETMQVRTSRNQERIRQIDREIADLGARNHIIARLHTNGAMNAVDYAIQSSEIGNRLTELRIERRQKLTEDEDDQLIATLKDLNGILDEYEPTVEFDNGLFDEIVESIMVNSSEQLTFKLIGGIALTEQSPRKDGENRMKNRTLPYGYCCKDGVIVIEPQESKVLKRIFAAYLVGSSMLTIAEQLNRAKIEYRDGVTGWNKGLLKHLIDNTKYLGTEGYPPTIDQATYEKIQKTKHGRNTQKNTDKAQDIFRLTVPVRCPGCGDRMRRRHDSR